MAKRFPIGVLDEYAKTLTLRQAAALYENKTHKKPMKRLFESMEREPASGKFTFYLSPYSIDEYINPRYPESSVQEAVMHSLGVESGLEFVNDVYEPGIVVMTDDEELYDRLINVMIEEYEIPDELIEDNLDPKFKN